jgi:septum formation protein
MLKLNHKIILASGSPRRKELLESLTDVFVVRIKDTAEDYPEEMNVEEVAAFLAWKKASAFKGELEKDELVLAADTIVIVEGEILGKPSNEEEAKLMLKRLSGKVHQVITGVCLMDVNKELVFQDEAKVYFKELTSEEITYYIKKFKPYDKAGSYGIQEWIGSIGVTKIEGSFYTIMGLPVHRVYEHLNQF